MKILKEEFKSVRFHTIIWTIILLFILIITTLMYPSFYKNKESFLIAFETVSPEFIKALGINKDVLFTPLGFYTFLFDYIMIIGAIQSSILGVKIIVNDKIFKTQEFLFTKPIRRNKLLNYKILSCVISLLITNIIFHFASIIFMNLINNTGKINLLTLFQINSSLLLTQFTFLSISMVFAAFVKKPKTSLGISLGVVLGFYLLSMIEGILNFYLLRYINPFSYFKVSDIVNDGKYHPSFIIVSVFIVVFCLNFTYRGYETEDIL